MTLPDSARAVADSSHPRLRPSDQKRTSGSTGDAGSWLPLIGTGKGCGHYVYGYPQASAKIAAFDLDGTIIQPQQGRKFPFNERDWEFLSDQIVPKLREAHLAGYAIALISNQAGGPKLATDFVNKLPSICRKIDRPLRAFAAFDFNEYRKGSPAIWYAFEALFNEGIAVDYASSFYVGDAAGRPGDHNDTDRKFAHNCGLPFFTPEEYFLGQPPDPNWKFYGFDARTYSPTLPLETVTESPKSSKTGCSLNEFGEPLEIVVLVGSPASGKTFYYDKYLRPQGYVSLNPSLFKSPSAALEALTTHLTNGRSIVIDAAHATVPSRLVYREALVHLSQTSGIRPFFKCIYFECVPEVVKHNSVYRALYGREEERKAVVELTVLREFERRFQPPSFREGFDVIMTRQFAFEETEEERKNWDKWLGDVYPGKAMKHAVKAERGGRRRGGGEVDIRKE